MDNENRNDPETMLKKNAPWRSAHFFIKETILSKKRSFHQQHVAGALDGGRDMALLLGGQSRNAARQDFTGFSDKTGKSFNVRKIEIQRSLRMLLSVFHNFFRERGLTHFSSAKASIIFHRFFARKKETPRYRRRRGWEIRTARRAKNPEARFLRRRALPPRRVSEREDP